MFETIDKEKLRFCTPKFCFWAYVSVWKIASHIQLKVATLIEDSDAGFFFAILFSFSLALNGSFTLILLIFFGPENVFGLLRLLYIIFKCTLQTYFIMEKGSAVTQ